MIPPRISVIPCESLGYHDSTPNTCLKRPLNTCCIQRGRPTVPLCGACFRRSLSPPCSSCTERRARRQSRGSHRSPQHSRRYISSWSLSALKTPFEASSAGMGRFRFRTCRTLQRLAACVAWRINSRSGEGPQRLIFLQSMLLRESSQLHFITCIMCTHIGLSHTARKAVRTTPLTLARL